MKVDSDFVMSINGESVTTEHTLPVYNPANRSVFAQVPDASKAQLDATVAAARQAFADWSQTPVDERQAALERFADLLEEHAEEFRALLTAEQGKPAAGTEWEVYGSVAWLRAIATQRLPDEMVEETGERRVVTRYMPVGVVGAIVPWNFPILLAVWKIAPAIMAGCTVVLKPSPYTPLCDLKLAELAQQAFPPGVLNAVSGGDIDEDAAGWFVPVTLIDNPPEDSRIVREEPFGPILPLLKWSDEADVIARANDTIYGLGASVWGKDLEAVERIGSQLEAGTVWLNEVHQYSPFQAFGGHKQSGLGCENSLHGLMEYTNWQTITMNKSTG